MPEPSFSIVLPMYNEEAAAADTINGITAWLEKNAGDREWAITATNDGSKDRTLEILQGLAAGNPRLHVENHTVNKGYGAAMRTGFQSVVARGFDYALAMDADGTQDPAYIARFYEPMRRGVGFIKATRYAKGGGTEGVPFARRLNSWGGNLLAKVLLRLPITDYTNGFRAIRRDILEQLRTKENGFSMLIEEVAQARRAGASFDEVPYILTVRKQEGSTSKFVYSWRMYKSYLRQLFP